MTASGADFLSQLAAKTIGAATLIEPRLPSRFEANAAGTGILDGVRDAPVEAPAGVETIASPPASSLRRPAVQPVQNDPGEPEAAPEPPLETPRPRTRRTTAVDTPAEFPAPSQASAPTLASPARPVARTDERPPAPEPVQLLVAAPPPQPERRLPPHADPDPAPRASPAPPVRADETARDRRAIAPEVAEPASPVAARPTLTPQSPPPTLAAPVRPPEILPHRSRRDDAPAAALPPPPAVTITIGRVEVRASVAAAQPARPAQPSRAAPQSLADYFQQRNAAR